MTAHRTIVLSLQEEHKKKFPVTEQLMALVLVVEMNLHERERWNDKLEDIPINDYTRDNVLTMFNKLFVHAATAFENPHLSGVRLNTGSRSFLILEEGQFEDGSCGYWTMDEEDQTEGFLEADSDAFWTVDANDAWIVRRFTGRVTGRKEKGKGKGQSRKGGKTG